MVDGPATNFVSSSSVSLCHTRRFIVVYRVVSMRVSQSLCRDHFRCDTLLVVHDCSSGNYFDTELWKLIRLAAIMQGNTEYVDA